MSDAQPEGTVHARGMNHWENRGSEMMWYIKRQIGEVRSLTRPLHGPGMRKHEYYCRLAGLCLECRRAALIREIAALNHFIITPLCSKLLISCKEFYIRGRSEKKLNQ